MPKFRVYGGNDAWALMVAVVEAANMAEAVNIAEEHAHELEWLRTGDTLIYDDFELFTDMTEEMEPDEPEPEEINNIQVTEQEQAILLAALRLWQKTFENGRPGIDDSLIAIATNCGAHPILEAGAIDDLCARINA